jgi:uncharacterized glyoxalase superfamily protein PhnB
MSTNPKPEGGLANLFRGDRYAALKDPFGVAWVMNGPVRK